MVINIGSKFSLRVMECVCAIHRMRCKGSLYRKGPISSWHVGIFPSMASWSRPSLTLLHDAHWIFLNPVIFNPFFVSGCWICVGHWGQSWSSFGHIIVVIVWSHWAFYIYNYLHICIYEMENISSLNVSTSWLIIYYLCKMPIFSY